MYTCIIICALLSSIFLQTSHSALISFWDLPLLLSNPNQFSSKSKNSFRDHDHGAAQIQPDGTARPHAHHTCNLQSWAEILPKKLRNGYKTSDEDRKFSKNNLPQNPPLHAFAGGTQTSLFHRMSTQPFPSRLHLPWGFVHIPMLSQYVAPSSHCGVVREDGHAPMFSKCPTMPWWTMVSAAGLEGERSRTRNVAAVFIVFGGALSTLGLENNPW